MTRVRVTAAGGITLRGPVTVELSAAQAARRLHLFGALSLDEKSRLLAQGGALAVDGRDAVSFKLGEEFGVDDLAKMALAQVEVLADAGSGEVAAPPARKGRARA
jgi:hypothetical protein